jgi:hypothetical protein
MPFASQVTYQTLGHNFVQTSSKDVSAVLSATKPIGILSFSEKNDNQSLASAVLHTGRIYFSYKAVRRIALSQRVLLFSYVGTVAFKAAYGSEIQSENDFYIKLVDIAMEPLLMVVHGNYLVDFLPFLKYIPGKTLNISEPI